MKKLDRTKIERAVRALGETQFDCGEWNRDDSDEDYDKVYLRAAAAEQALWRLLKPVIA